MASFVAVIVYLVVGLFVVEVLNRLDFDFHVRNDDGTHMANVILWPAPLIISLARGMLFLFITAWDRGKKIAATLSHV